MQSVEDNLAVIDIGKTSAKILCFDRGGNLINDTRLKPNWIVNKGISELDVNHYWNWIMDSLEVFYDEAGVRHTIVTAHGCTFALIRNEKLALPILDYENEPPTEINKEFDNIKPSFSETYTPRLPMGLNYAVHIFWRQKKFPEIFEECDSILSLPQYWGWKFTGKKVSEISYIGCHSYLWSPMRNEPSSLTKKKGWDKKFPKFKRAGEFLGSLELKIDKKLKIYNGLHDSNSSLYFYRSLGFKSFTLISTGTWVVIFNTDTSLKKLDPERDMLCNITVDNKPIATARFMGGRDFDLISHSYRSPINRESIDYILGSDIFALPSFTSGGPFPKKVGEVVGENISKRESLAALATIYLVCMTKEVLDLLDSKNTIVIDGGFANNMYYMELLKELCSTQKIYCNKRAEGTSLGAATIAFENINGCRFDNPCKEIIGKTSNKMKQYYTKWKSLVC